MKDEKNDLMSIFGSGQELDFGSNFYDEDHEDEDEKTGDDNPDDNNTIENEDSEEVDGNEDDADEGSEADDDSPNLYSSVADVLLEQGLLPSLESSKEIKSVDDFTNALKKEIDIQSNSKVEEYLNNLDLEKIATLKKSNIELDSVDEDYLKDNLEKAKEIIYQDYLNQGLSEDRAKRQLKKAIDLGEDVLIEEALESKESIKLYNANQEKVEKERYLEVLKQQKIEEEKTTNAIKQYVLESKEVIKGIPNTKAIGERVLKAMIEPVAKNPQTGEMENKFMNERSKNPIEFDTKMYYLFELTNGFTDLSKIKVTATSSATRNLEKAIRKVKFEDNGQPGYLTDPDSYSGYGSELVV